MSSESFLSRWSRRKVGVDAEPAQETAAPESVAEKAPLPVTEGVSQLPTADRAQAENAFVEPPPLDTLTHEGDFAPFMQREVTPELRNQAMKKLFTDPHYNVMDRLDTYIDDYSKPDPMPPGMLRRLHQAKALFLFDDEEKEAGDAKTSPPADVAAVEKTAGDELLALSPAEKQPQPKLEE